jgi:hypothetical protein
MYNHMPLLLEPEHPAWTLCVCQSNQLVCNAICSVWHRPAKGLQFAHAAAGTVRPTHIISVSNDREAQVKAFTELQQVVCLLSGPVIGCRRPEQ